MSAAFFPVFEDPALAAPTQVSGKALAHHMKLLDQIAASAGVTPLLGFFSLAQDEVEDMLGEIEMPPLQWFSAHDGLATVRALRAGVSPSEQALLDDLAALEAVLLSAAAAAVRWRLVADV